MKTITTALTVLILLTSVTRAAAYCGSLGGLAVAAATGVGGLGGGVVGTKVGIAGLGGAIAGTVPIAAAAALIVGLGATVAVLAAPGMLAIPCGVDLAAWLTTTVAAAGGVVTIVWLWDDVQTHFERLRRYGGAVADIVSGWARNGAQRLMALWTPQVEAATTNEWSRELFTPFTVDESWPLFPGVPGT